MTLEQLAIFVAVAERQHLTRGAQALGLTPSAASSAIRTLEGFHGVELFHRVGRRIELTAIGRAFLGEARATLARAKSAELMLSDMSGLARGEISVFASQTIAGYWLPPILLKFKRLYPGVALTLTIGNTRTVADAIRDGLGDVGFVEGMVDEPALSVLPIVADRLVVVASPVHPFGDGRAISRADITDVTAWVLREKGSGTRSAFEEALAGMGIGPGDISVMLELPSNEAVVSAVRSGDCATAVSGMVAAPFLRQGLLVRAGIDLPTRSFAVLRHKERHRGRAAEELERISRAAADEHKAGLMGL
ncbi:LysR substrate-binding domain-containing protein [Neorhizobium sp. NPDC001467]|uniref:LysR family transcriptional regulator n=1 Tax=Neorhizobium sp. NPDC001467 TaxID=3390595 RepID=UPI003D059316